ncbi:DegT/DnrJ/EryC1/StrS family aminotransferase [Dactylosporangium matsuzakiense]|uniref:dTDP-4-dehydro-6-deoxyglucose aminotransferase n=1 Tax=Dactylosporangium matsuzakiense TaxID=53360 RepID=A0A9W6NMG5_9ACTN|nr:DegT/DnrJ/EryC1/StrS family aminotransferase [Dactylosporangium matsuzakiense]GLL02143.1 dTDP-4-dehydro-6-deoxyglucose aminotransferase [Dactylosporangium matsuzakiense]
MTSVTQPAILGGRPILAAPVMFAQPTVSSDATTLALLGEVLASGALTKGPQLTALEREIAEFLGVGHAVAVASGSAGLMLALRCLGVSGNIIMPSFTFMATAHAAVWNGLTPLFVDIDPDTLTVAPDSVSAALRAGAGAVMPVHVSGTPADTANIMDLAGRHNVPVIIDAAPAFGARYPDGRLVGTKGLAEIFSLSPTKSFTAGEGGIVATNDGHFAAELRVAREYGNPGDFDSAMVGTNGRMPELSAALARRNLARLDDVLDARRRLVARYRQALSCVAGLRFQRVPAGASSTFKDLSLTVSAEQFGLDRDTFARALAAEQIPTRQYFDPPVHRQTAYRHLAGSHPPLPNTERAAREVIVLPLYSHMPEAVVDQVVTAVARIHRHAEAIRAFAAAVDAGRT